MTWTYFKRYRMEIDLRRCGLVEPPTPPGYLYIPWDDALLETHARVKHISFRHEIDANVFPCFLDEASCRRLMLAIVSKAGFLPEATWLAAYRSETNGQVRYDYCGTIQGILDYESCLGSIQNVGVTPPHRERGLATGLLYRCLRGFQQAGAHRVYLEVTAENEKAIRVYQRIGFQITRTTYKVAEAPIAG